MNKSKTKEKPLVVDITPRVLRYWFIDADKKIKHVSEYIGKLISFDPKAFHVYDDAGNKVKVYTTYREASITHISLEIEVKRKSWKSCVDMSMQLNDEISALLDKLDKLRDTGD